MRTLHATARAVAIAADHAIGWLLLITVLLNVAQVFTRYVMNAPLFWTEEMIRYATVWLTFVGAAAASQYGDHMDMNMFTEVKSPRFQAIHQALIHGLVLLFSILLTWQGARFCILNGMQTAPATGLPMLVVYGATAIGGVMLILVSIHKIILCLTGESTREEPA